MTAPPDAVDEVAFGEAALDYDRLLQTIARSVAERIGQFCHVRLISEDGKRLESVALHDTDPEALSSISEIVQRVPLEVDEHPIARAVIESGQARLISDVDPERFRADVKPEYWPALERFMPSSLIVAPLGVRSRTVGLLYVARRTGPPLQERDLELARDLAQRAAIVIDNARLYRDLKERATRLEITEQRFATTLRGIGDAVIAADEHDRVTFLNPPAERLTGWSLEEAQGKKLDRIFDIRDERTLEPLGRPDARATTGDGAARTPAVLVGRDGSQVPIDESLSPTFAEDGSRSGVVLVFRDATHSRLASRRRKLLAEASKVLLSSLDYEQTLGRVARLTVPELADWCVVDLVNDAGGLERVAIAHADPDKVRLAQEFQRRYPPDPAATTGVAHVIRSGEPELVPEIPAEWLRSMPDPERRRLVESLGLRSYLIVPMIARGRTLGALSCVSAESGRHYDLYDQELLEELAGRAAYAVDNARLFKLSQEAVAARDEFLSIASHELRTPLTPLGLQLEMLQQSLARMSPLPDAAVRQVEIARRQVDRLARLVEGLLDVSRIATGRLRLAPEDLDLSTVVREMLAAHRDQADRAGCTLELEVDGPVRGRWDRGRIEQIVANLLSNAIKYSPGKSIQVRVRQHDDEAEIAVTDRGLGIASEDIDRIFGRFERAVSARQYGGLGLGLYIARQLARAHGGEIEVESRLGEGATFRVRLPSGAAARRLSGAARDRPILLVDDDQDIRETVAELLADRGWVVHTADSGRAALEQAHDCVPRLILLDMMMPDMDGWAFMAELRKRPELSSVPVVVFSAHESAAEMAASLGMAGCLKKPFQLSDLLRVVEQNVAALG